MSPNDSNISSTWQTAAWPAIQATIFTWAVTAAGSALVFVLPAEQTTFQKQLLDSLLGFAAGVMTAAAFFSLLAPAIAFASEASSMWHFCPALPVAMGFGLGGGFLFYTDLWLERNGLEGAGSLEIMLHGCLPPASLRVKSKSSSDGTGKSQSLTPPGSPAMSKRDSLTRRGGTSKAGIASPGLLVRGKSFDMEVGGELSREQVEDDDAKGMQKGVGGSETSARWRRMWLLIIAITLHNFPEGLAVGVGFGTARKRHGADEALASNTDVDYNSARSLAFGIALQNFPEGLAVSMPLRREGMPSGRAFLLGQASGLVEPLGGLLGAYAVVVAEPLLPLTMAFAAGAMIFVVVDQLVPEAHEGSPRLATAGFLCGFGLMMAMDVTFD